LLFCGKYLEKNIELKAQCEEYEIECSRLDNYEASICAGSFDACPINDISLVSSEEMSSSEIPILSTSKIAQNKMPILSFALVEGSIKCKSSLGTPHTQVVENKIIIELFCLFVCLFVESLSYQ